MNIVAILLCTVFLLLSAIHVYWAVGGHAGRSYAVPELEGEPLFRPGKFVTMLVAIVLTALALLAVLLNWPDMLGLKRMPLVIYAGWFFCILFAVRAVGEFKYIGIFKRIRNTRFAEYDTKYYSPLCLIISVLLGLLAYSA